MLEMCQQKNHTSLSRYKKPLRTMSSVVRHHKAGKTEAKEVIERCLCKVCAAGVDASKMLKSSCQEYPLDFDGT